MRTAVSTRIRRRHSTSRRRWHGTWTALRRVFGRNVNVPVMIIAIGSNEQVNSAVTELAGMVANPLLTVERVRLCKRDGEMFARPPQLPMTDGQGRALWQKLMVYTAETTRHDELPIHRALVQRLLRSGTAPGRPCCAASGDSTVIINRTGTSCFRSPDAYR